MASIENVAGASAGDFLQQQFYYQSNGDINKALIKHLMSGNHFFFARDH
jgi:hypothetical protein